MTTPLIMIGLLCGPLIIIQLIQRIAKRNVIDYRTQGCLGIMLVFGFTGLGHFVKTVPMAQMLPAWVPMRLPLVYLTGTIELLLAIAVVIPRSRRVMGWILIVMLLLFLPVNIYAAVNRVGMGGHLWGPAYLWIRVPLQLLLVGWTWWFAARPRLLQPICFVCTAVINQPAEQITRQILDLSKWTEFSGYGPMPGIRTAEFEVRTQGIVGTRIRVINTDGSQHIEEILQWQPATRIKLELKEFSAPLCYLATHFVEQWDFTTTSAGTNVERAFELHARSALSQPLLGIISFLLKRAIQSHLQQMQTAALEKK